MRLDGKAIVVTGAGRGIGAAYATALGAAGARVVVNDIDAEAAEAIADQIRSDGGDAIAEPSDIARPEKAAALIERCVAAFGAIDGLVNNAAIMIPARLEQDRLESLRAMIDVNIIGTFNCARAAIEPMLAAGKGAIVNVTSGAQTGQTALGGYGATKGAVASFTYAWAGELAGSGVRVNAISPMAASAMSGVMGSYLREQGVVRTAGPAMPAPETNAPLMVYLLSDRAAGITGQIVRIDGTRLSLMTHPAIRAPIIERETWTPDAIADAFDATLAANQLPTDVHLYEIEMVR
ncbi:SDR family NAD(P)-dependent oxidoreductase [Sphingomonas crocodyli]|uniref:SDR family oxidoreductase n=1 Tax=Sphingomonas crocodyli TaxID=1979270 RepID=A0A437M964_9SPHN|nr:SDR family oxidoreductase [Sphingomonas crocodyli]RVT94250.1 SDR family oxidoreductase [Sphingomonas crocodyli]